MSAFIFWGVFAAFGAIVVLYAVWMVIANRRDPRMGEADRLAPPPPVSELEAPDAPSALRRPEVGTLPPADPGGPDPSSSDDRSGDDDPSDEGPVRTFWVDR